MGAFALKFRWQEGVIARCAVEGTWIGVLQSEEKVQQLVGMLLAKHPNGSTNGEPISAVKVSFERLIHSPSNVSRPLRKTMPKRT